jgi:hypothetical protein
MSELEPASVSGKTRQGRLARAVGTILFVIVIGWFAVMAIVFVIFAAQSVSQ